MKMYFVVLLLCFCVAFCNGRRPNIVLFLTDDQDLTQGGVTPMKNTIQMIANEGVTFVHSYVASPICCPSRATILSGLYPHNHGTRNNSLVGGCNGPAWQQLEAHTFATALKSSGYDTFYAGKYLNQYGNEKAGGPQRVPPGWTEWQGLVGNSVYYNFTLSNNGNAKVYNHGEYLTDVIRNLALKFIEAHAKSQRPFLLVLAPPAAHAPFTPAPRHAGRFSNVTAQKNPNFNVKPVNKHWLMNMSPSPLPEHLLAEVDRAYRQRWETLLSVDEMVADVVQQLTKQDQINNTYVIFTSDNGYHMGLFSQVYDKRQPYESDIKVPLFMRGPLVKPRSLIYQPTTNVDLAPTIMKLAGIRAPEHMDGVPLDSVACAAGIVKGASKAFVERNLLVEYNGEGSKSTVEDNCPWANDGSLSECHKLYGCKCQDSRNNTYACVRHLHPHADFKYCKFQDAQEFEEAYDLNRDPYEIENIISRMLPAVKYKYRYTLEQLVKCRTSIECNILHNNVPTDVKCPAQTLQP